MKIVIDIPEEVYKNAMDGIWCKALFDAIKNGISVNTCEDCVSRKDVIKAVYDWLEFYDPFEPDEPDLDDVLGNLPSVEPEKCGDCIEKQKAISELQPPTDNWGNYADRLYDLAYLSGYNDGLVAKGSQDNNV